MNERLPIFQPMDSVTEFPVIPAPSMRRRGSGDSMEELIRRTLEDDDDDDDDDTSGTVERMPERMVATRMVGNR